MASLWELKIIGGQRKTFADWGFSELRLDLQSLALDTATWLHDGCSFDAAPAVPQDSNVILYQDGLQIFTGVVKRIPRSGAAEYERQQYQAVGPWYWLEHLVYQQLWKYMTGKNQDGSAIITTVINPHLLVNLDANLNKVLTDNQIKAVLQFASTQIQAKLGFAPFQIGTIGASVDVPVQEIQAWTCAQIIRQQLRFTPDAVGWFDYSTTPPTFNIKRRTTMAVWEVTPGGTSEYSEVMMTPLHELLVPSVVIYFEKTDTATVDGQSKTFRRTFIDLAPLSATGLEVGAMVVPVTLKGSVVNSETATINVQPIAIDDLDWWQEKEPELASDLFSYPPSPILDSSLQWPDGTPEDALPNEIVQGSWKSWMPFSAARLVALADVECILHDDSGTPINNMPSKPLRAKVIATDCPTLGVQTFSRTTSSEAGELPPVGMAAYLLSNLNVLQWQGSFDVTSNEINVLKWSRMLGRVINVISTNPETKQQVNPDMNAVVQSVEIDVENGKAHVTFGPQNQLGVQDLMEWLRGLRAFRPVTPFKDMQTGEDSLASSGAESSLFHAAEDTATGNERSQLQVYAPDSAPTSKKATIDVTSGQVMPGYIIKEPVANQQGNLSHDKVWVMDNAKVEGVKINTVDCKGHILTVKEVGMCKEDGTKGYALVVISDTYDAPLG